MDLDKQITYPEDIILPDEFGPQDMEYAITRLFIIDLMRLVELKATLAKNFHIQPSEIDNMPYWEYELFLESLNNQVKEENERQEEDMKKYKINDSLSSIRSMSNPKKFSSSFSPQMPSLGSMKTPSFKF